MYKSYTVMTLRAITEAMLEDWVYDSCAIATDGGSIAVILRDPGGVRFSVILDGAVGSSTLDRLYLDGDRDALIGIGEEGPWLNLLRRISSDGSIPEKTEQELVNRVRDVVERRHES